MNVNSKKLTKIVSIIMTIMMILSITSTVFADMPDPKSFTGDTSSGAASSANTIINQILGVVQIIGVGVAVIMLIVLAIKYISAAPGDKAEIKKSAVVYIVGAVILFGATGLLQIVKQFGITINNSVQ